MRHKIIFIMFMITITSMLGVVKEALACPDGTLTCSYLDTSNIPQTYTADFVGICWGSSHGLIGCWACNTQQANNTCKSMLASASHVTKLMGGQVQTGLYVTIFDGDGKIVHTY